MERIVATIVFLLLGAPLYLPWLLVRIGKYKVWYLAHFAPPFMWGRVIYGWPVTAVFVCAPFIGLLPVQAELKNQIWAIISVAGIILGIIMIIWTPRWAKPKWQQYLEANYSWLEIRGVFIPEWRKMNRDEWTRLLDSEAGIEELVRRARESQAQ